MSYRDHANRHGYGGTDPALFGWTSSDDAAAAGRIAASIYRDGAATAQNVATGSLAVTTTAVQHNQIGFQTNMTADIVSTPSRLVCEVAGFYLIVATASWGTFWTGTDGACIGIVLAASGLVNPLTTSRSVASDSLMQEAVAIYHLNYGDIVVQCVGQNTGVNRAAPLAGLTAWRLGI